MLIRYAVPVLRQLLKDGRIVSKATKLGRPPGGSQTWLDFTQADREDFALNMVAGALPVFTTSVFEKRCWTPGRGASLKTYFVNACILQFPALFRAWLDQRQAVRPSGLDLASGCGDLALDPAITVVLRDEVDRMLAKIADPQLQEVLILRGAGYTAAAAARQAGLTAKAAEGRLARIRKGLKDQQASTEPSSTSSTRPVQARTPPIDPPRLSWSACPS